MHIKIHRGTKEIGGTCVEIWTANTRLLLDFGMPLVDKNGDEFDFGKFKDLPRTELVNSGILPDVKGLYELADCKIDGVIISHAHQDHYGLINYISNEIMFYLGEATHKLIEINNYFTPQHFRIENFTHLENSKPFQIGDFTITPYSADHSAFDSYSFLIEADGKRIFYSGDFRNHGRERISYASLLQNPPTDVDYLLLEGTTISRESKPFKSEVDIENDLTSLFDQSKSINLIYTSGQNIDRIISIFEACVRSNKILVVDVYIAHILKTLSVFDIIPFPSKSLSNVRVMFPFYTSRKLKNDGNQTILYQFKNYKITKEEISDKAANIVMIVRPSMQKDLEYIAGIEGGNLIYSLWEGYLEAPGTKKFINYLITRNFTIHHIHTSGHADVKTLKELVSAIKPKAIIPIHTNNPTVYERHFTVPIKYFNDRSMYEL